MSKQLDQIRSLRPEAPSPTRHACESALERLRAAAIRERGTAASGPSRRSPRRPRPKLGGVISLAGSVALVVVVGAIALSAHGRRHAAGHSEHRATTAGSHARGEIRWQNGDALARSRVSHAVQIDTAKLPAVEAARTVVYERLAAILGVSTKPVTCQIAGRTGARLAKLPCAVARQQALAVRRAVTVAMNVPLSVIDRVARQSRELPGVSARAVSMRVYPSGDLAAQTLGTVGPLTRAEQRLLHFPGTPAPQIVGQSGLEAEYDRFLSVGDTLRTSLNLRLQQAGQRALQHAITINRPATGGSFVAMNPQDGSIYAMGSLPTFNPSIFTTGNLPQRTYHRLTSKGSNEPLLNRAIDSAGPTGSTFKPITATAALESGNWTVGSIYHDMGSFQVGAATLHNVGNAAYGSLDLVNALRVSSDTFFYNLGARTNVANPFATPQGGPLQTWAQRFGIGRATGIDIPGESAGTLPSPAFRESRNRLEAQCDAATGPFKGKPKHTAGGCGIADGTNRPWSIGDNINLAVGQGDVQATPLQLAVTYAALANGGTIVRPHVGESIQNQDGTVLQNINPPPSRRLAINPIYLETIRQGLRDAASQPGGTSAAVFSNFPQQVYGKTGTAQYTGQQDYSWYACFVPASATTKPIVVVVHVEQGGFGAVAAAPVARQILSQWFFSKPGPYVAGSSKTL